MDYSYINHSADKIKELINKSVQYIKSTTLLTHTKFDSTVNGYKSQISSFSNRVVQDHPIYQHYGFASAPLAGTKAISLGMAGSNTNNIIVATHDDRYQPQNLQAGEVSLHDYQGQAIELRQDQSINVIGQGNINISANNTVTVSSNGNVVMTIRGGSVYVQNLVVSNGWSGTFSTPTGETVKVDAGIITDCS